MKLLTFDIQKNPGFRFNLTDLIFIVLLGFSSVLIYRFFGTFYALYLFPLYIGFTFFLFCNVFRVGTRLELSLANHSKQDQENPFTTIAGFRTSFQS